MNWNEAQQTCMSHGSHLSSIADEDEADFLYREIKTSDFSLARRYVYKWCYMYFSYDTYRSLP